MSRQLIRVFMIAAGLLLGGVPVADAQGASQGHADHTPGQEKPQPKPAAAGHDDHAAHQKPVEQKRYPADIPPLTDDDRAAAFPRLEAQGHAAHDTSMHYFVLFDQLEFQTARGRTGGSWDNRGWVGGDVDRFWFRSEADVEDGSLEDAEVHALYGRAVHRWWDVVAGVRQDFGTGPSRTWAAVGLQGLAPYFFEVEATAYIGESGRTHFRFETEYELLLTNRLVLQPLLEVQVFGKSDPERQIGAGLSSAEAGLRLRWEIRRELAPYVGITWNGRFFGTADLARAAGEQTGAARFVTGLRLWF
jgi:copper resistance protein B